VAVARALANDAGILLADEPTASLHREAADALIGDLVSLARDRGRTMIAVSHDLTLLDRMDRVLTITDGTVMERQEAA
jgi:putative ABC transport system ATP-binding protein